MGNSKKERKKDSPSTMYITNSLKIENQETFFQASLLSSITAAVAASAA
jgi:hypothetical protein